MSAPSYIRRHINNFVGDQPFSIRDFLVYGPRNTVDQVFHRLIKSGRIIRVARGVFIKCDAPLPSPLEIAQVKAAAFGKTIVTHGSQAGRTLSLRKMPQWQSGQIARRENELVFASSGATSSFMVGNQVVRFIATSARKMQPGDSSVGLAIRALWHLGRRACGVETAALTVSALQKDERRQLRLAAALMPAWLRNCLAKFSRMNCLRPDLESKEPPWLLKSNHSPSSKGEGKSNTNQL